VLVASGSSTVRATTGESRGTGRFHRRARRGEKSRSPPSGVGVRRQLPRRVEGKPAKAVKPGSAPSSDTGFTDFTAFRSPQFGKSRAPGARCHDGEGSAVVSSSGSERPQAEVAEWQLWRQPADHFVDLLNHTFDNLSVPAPWEEGMVVRGQRARRQTRGRRGDACCNRPSSTAQPTRPARVHQRRARAAERLPSHPASRIDELLAHRWQRS
jgi:hypothetical protein